MNRDDDRIERVALIICLTVFVSMLSCGGFMVAIAILMGGLKT